MHRLFLLFLGAAVACGGTTDEPNDAGGDTRPERDASVGTDSMGSLDANSDADPLSDAGAADSATDAPVTEDRVAIVVGLGWQGITVLSTDEGRTWCETGIMVDPHDDLFRGAGYHDGLFVGAHAGEANRGAIIVSTNGYEWEPLHRTNFDSSLPENPAGQWYAGAAFGNEKWFAAGGCGRMAHSTDGRTWEQTPQFLDGCTHIRTVAFGDGFFVVGVDDDNWYRSASGETDSWELFMEGAGSRVLHDTTGFHGPEDDEEKWRGRGICMWGAGWEATAHIMRSPNEDCSEAERVSDTSHSVTTILYGDAPAADFLPGAVPGALSTCLGL